MCLEGRCNLWSGAHTGAGLLKELQPMGDPCWRSPFLKDSIPSKGAAWEGMHPMGGTLHCSRGRARGRSNIRDEALWTDCNSHSPSLVLPKAGTGRRTEIEVESGKKGRVSESGLLLFFSVLTVLLLSTGKKLN